MEGNVEKLAECMKNEEFVKELFAQNSNEEAQAYLEKNGIELTMTEVGEIREFLKKVASGEISKETLEKAANGELSETELAAVAGGSALLGLGVALLCGVLFGGGMYGAAKLAQG